MSYNDANKVDDELFESLRSRYQGNFVQDIKKHQGKKVNLFLI